MKLKEKRKFPNQKPFRNYKLQQSFRKVHPKTKPKQQHKPTGRSKTSFNPVININDATTLTLTPMLDGVGLESEKKRAKNLLHPDCRLIRVGFFYFILFFSFLQNRIISFSTNYFVNVRFRLDCSKN